nr:hypothetical protein [Tanacetum cinerariifolium]
MLLLLRSIRSSMSLSLTRRRYTSLPPPPPLSPHCYIPVTTTVPPSPPTPREHHHKPLPGSRRRHSQHYYHYRNPPPPSTPPPLVTPLPLSPLHTADATTIYNHHHLQRGVTVYCSQQGGFRLDRGSIINKGVFVSSLLIKACLFRVINKGVWLWVKRFGGCSF